MKQLESGTRAPMEESQGTGDGQHIDTMTINMGPQHPSTHGVLRLILTIEGETVIKAVPDIGFLHTGIEKTAEAKTYHQELVLTDRMEYLSPLCNNLGYSLALSIVQQVEGYVSHEALQAVAEAIGMLVDDVESIATFYTMFYQQSPGETVNRVCTSISCYLRNCDALVSHFENRLGIKRGETSADGTYTLLTAECLASCGTASVLQVNDEFVERVTLEMADALIDTWKKE